MTFTTFALKLWPETSTPFVEGDHIFEVAEALEKVATGETKRLIIMLPPRYGKTLLASELFTAYFAGIRKGARILHVGNDIHAAKRYAASAERVTREPTYKEVYPEVVSATRHTAGVAQSMFGIQVDLAVVDSPHDEQEYQVGLTRPDVYDSTYAWFNHTVRQRTAPDGAIIVIASRMSKHDLIGKLLAEEGDKWTVVKVPAINAEGKSTWPAFWSTEDLITRHGWLGTDYWNAQYQQEPVDGGE